MEIREYQLSDKQSAEALVSLVTKELRKIYRQKVVSKNESAVAMELFDKLVASVENEIVGIVEYRVINDYCYIQGLAVSSEHRKQSIARKLINKVALIASNAGANKLTLVTIEETRNVGIFEKMGFEITERMLSECFESDSHANLYESHMERKLT